MKESITLFALSLNFIVGGGVLSIPYSFINGGILAGVLTLFFCSLLILMSSLWLFDVQTFCEFKKITSHSNSQISKERSLELNEMCLLLIGPRAMLIYDIAVTVYVISSAWIYTSVFSLSLQQTKIFVFFANLEDDCQLSNVSGPLWQVQGANFNCYLDYLCFTFIFMIIQIFMISFGLERIKFIQVWLTGVGIIALCIMICWSLMDVFFTNHVKFNHLTTSDLLFNSSYFGHVFSSFVFAQLVHMAIPTLISLASKEGKKLAPLALTRAIATTTLLYILLGTFSSLNFGRHTQKVITLNWGSPENSWFKEVLRCFLLIYPCITCGAAFPLYVISLGNNFTKSNRVEQQSTDLETFLLDNSNHSNLSTDAMRYIPEKSKNKTCLIFIFSAVMPILLACIMADTKYIITFIGFASFTIGFFIPSALQLKLIRNLEELSKEEIEKLEINKSFWNGKSAVYFCIIFGIVACFLSMKVLI